ncbi:MAG: type II toxin-antitoxin system HicA family toxin [Phycisphaerales bacterium]|nr:type II toxin-antitoxin system HicA family toxin [Phycisphaerales bacterium]
MSHRNQRTLEHLFQHPIAVNIKWSDIVRMFESFGADVEELHGVRERVKLNGVEETFRIPHGKTLNLKDEVMQIRHFLERAGVTPGK